MKEYVKPMTNVEEAVMVSMITDSINVGVSNENADKCSDVLTKENDAFGNLW